MPPDRLALAAGAEHFEFLRGYDQVDMALDTFPYNGGTTTAEALWQGVPVLTFNGDRWARRTRVSLLRAAGLDEWVAADVAGFDKRRVALRSLANTPGRCMAALPARMRERLGASAAWDVARHCAARSRLST